MRSTILNFDDQSLITPALVRKHRPGWPSPPDERSVAAARDQLLLIFAIAQTKIEARQPWPEVLHWLSLELHGIRGRMPADVWSSLMPVAQAHPLADLLRSDPFTDWSFRKPRGYSGDAELLDFIYDHPGIRDRVARADAVGAAIHECTRASASCVAVRERRALLASYVDAIAAERGGGAEILAIAAGHLREATLSEAFRAGTIARWIALDQDPDSVAGIRNDHAGTAIEAVEGSVAGLLRGDDQLGSFDFVYAAGLYDYLPRAVAVKLTRRCVGMLKPHGAFLFANFSDRTTDAAFMEIFMNWELLLRSDEDIWDIVNASVDRNAVDAKVVSGDNGEITYALISKRS